MTIGNIIQSARKKAGLTQVELGALLGVSGSMIGQWENDLRKPKEETLNKIAEAIGQPFYDAFSEEAEKSELALRAKLAYARNIEQKEADILSKCSREEQQQRIESFVRIVMESAAQERLDSIEAFIHNELGLMTIDLFEKLNHAGRSKAVDYMRDLSESPKYQRTSNKEQSETPTEGNTPTTQEKPPEGQTAPTDGE